MLAADFCRLTSGFNCHFVALVALLSGQFHGLACAPTRISFLQHIATAARAVLWPPLRSQASLVPRSASTAPLHPFSSLTWGEDRTEPAVEVPVGRGADVADRRPAVVRGVAPTAAPIHTARACRCTSWISPSSIRAPIPIPTPLGDIPRHVVKPITVRRKGPHWTCRLGRSSNAPDGVVAIRSQIIAVTGGHCVVVGQFLRDGVAPRKPFSAQPAPGCLLPFGFRR